MATATQLEVPAGVLASARMTLEEVCAEFAVHLQEQGRLSTGKAHELAGLSLWVFRQFLGARHISPHLDAHDLQQDLEMLRGL